MVFFFFCFQWQVQPVAELVELSKRCMAPSTATVEEIDHSITNGNCNTLRRSASKRFKRQVSRDAFH